MSDRGLILHLPLNGSLRDRSQYRNHASRVGTESLLGWGAGCLGNGRGLDSESTANTSYVSIPNIPAYQSDVFSIAFWLRIDAWTLNYARIIDKNYTNGFVIHRNYNNSTLQFNIQNSTQLNSTSGVILAQWQHWAFTRTGSAGRWYLNGRLDVSGSINSAANTNVSEIRLFSSQVDTAYQKGGMCDLRMYNRVLTPVEVMHLYNRLRMGKSNV